MISVDPQKPQLMDPGVHNMHVDIWLSPAISDRLTFVRRSLLLFGAICLLVGSAFMILGAQPVLGFMGLEVVLLYFVYKYCERNARQAEHVTVSERHLIVRITDRHGRLSLARFDPRWTDLRLATKERGGGLIIVSKGRTCRFGDFLDPVEREEVLDLLLCALRRSPTL